MGFFIKWLWVKNQQCWHNKKIGKHLSTLKSNSGWMCPTVLSSHHQKNEKSIKKELVLIQHHWKRILQVMNAFFLLLCFLWMTCAQLLLHPSFDWNIHWKVYRVEYSIQKKIYVKSCLNCTTFTFLDIRKQDDLWK